MFIVGLTGGIGSGKSTVSALFQDLGVLVLDADDIGKSLVQPNTPLLASLIAHFGSSLLNADGSLDRPALRSIVFSNPHERHKLEALLHPPILAEMQQRAQQANAPYCIFSIPLLFESGQCKHVNRVLVIDAPVELQRGRVAQRNGLSQEEITGILNSQVSREYRLAQADDIIDNSQSLTNLTSQVTALHNKYMAIARDSACSKPETSGK